MLQKKVLSDWLTASETTFLTAESAIICNFLKQIIRQSHPIYTPIGKKCEQCERRRVNFSLKLFFPVFAQLPPSLFTYNQVRHHEAFEERPLRVCAVIYVCTNRRINITQSAATEKDQVHLGHTESFKLYDNSPA